MDKRKPKTISVKDLIKTITLRQNNYFKIEEPLFI